MQLIEAEIIEDIKYNKVDLESELCDKNNEFTKLDEANKKLEEVQEDLLHRGKIPDREIAKQVGMTDTIIDLALATLSRTSATKLIKIEKFLSKIEDELFSDSTISELSKGDLLQLYSQLRLLRSSTLQNVRDIRKEVNFEELELKMMAANAKGELSNIGDNVNEVIEKLMNNPDLLDLSKNLQKDEKNS